MHFQVLKTSKKSRARLGVLKTSHGEVETPCLVTVATQATVKTLTNWQAKAAGCGLLIANTVHLHLKPGEKAVRKAGGLHRFMGWNGPIMTDSGGFQVFSLGFGLDHGHGKVLKEKTALKISRGQQPKLLKITDDGALITSYLDGSKFFLGPKESMRIQRDLGADIIFAFDECTSPAADHDYTRHSLERTHRWAKISLKEHDPEQALFGVVQGGKFRDLRRESARFLASLPFDGFGIGGEFGDDKSGMARMIRWVTDELPENKPRHLLGIGHPDDIARIIKAGVDTFDCTVPTHYARHGTAFASRGRFDVIKSGYLGDRRPLDPQCDCFVCREHSRAYICHLLRSNEVTGLALLTFHNLHYFHSLVAKAREAIKKRII